MIRYIGLLRAINIGSHNQVSMPALRDLLTRLGFKGSRTILQSGNVVFDANRRSPAQLERLLESEIARALKVATDLFVRSGGEWEGIVERNPFTREAERDPGHLLLVVHKDKPPAPRVTELQHAIKGSELVRVDGRHSYIVYPDGIGRSKLTNALIEKKLGTRATARNWNTVVRLNSALRDSAVG